MPNKGELLQLGLQERDFVDLTAITPRNIETASIGVAQILVKGSYSEILKPGVDYLETDENFGNIEEIVDFVFDNKRIGEMTDSCWATVSQNQSLRLSNLLPAQDLWLKNLKFSNDDSYDALTRIVQKLQYWNGYSRYFLKKAENALEHRKGKILKLNNRYELRG
jgi:hypothetical protein